MKKTEKAAMPISPSHNARPCLCAYRATRRRSHEACQSIRPKIFTQSADHKSKARKTPKPRVMTMHAKATFSYNENCYDMAAYLAS
jgi:hypothetical protein